MGRAHRVRCRPACRLGCLAGGPREHRLGTAWAAQGGSLLAQVPSVIVPEEHNLLINPAHPQAGKLRVAKLRRWLYDPRALRLPL